MNEKQEKLQACSFPKFRPGEGAEIVCKEVAIACFNHYDLQRHA